MKKTAINGVLDGEQLDYRRQRGGECGPLDEALVESYARNLFGRSMALLE